MDAATLARTATTVPLRVVLAGRADLAVAIEALTNLDWLGTAVPSDKPEAPRRRILTDLELPVRDGSARSPIRKSAHLDLGLPRRLDDAVRVEVGWRSATLAPLFPVFEGAISITPAQVTLEGSYLPPLGRLGLVIDRGALHLVARRTAEALLARLAARFDDGDAGGSRTTAPAEPAAECVEPAAG